MLFRSSNAQGDLARTLDSPTNQLRIMKEQVRELSIQFGIALIPTFKAVLDAAQPLLAGLRSLVSWFQNLSPETRTMIISVTALVAALGPLALIISGVSAALAVLLSPVGLVIAALTALGVAAYQVIQNWELIKTGTSELIDALYENLVGRFNSIVESVSLKIEEIVGFFQNMFDVVVGNSIVPEMMDRIDAEFGRMGPSSKKATDDVAKNFMGLQKFVALTNTEMGQNFQSTMQFISTSEIGRAHV